MGSKSSSQPPSPAQGANQYVSQYTPWGSNVYSQVGKVQVHGGPDQPIMQSNVTLTPQQQALFGTQQATEQEMANLANAQTGRLAGTLGTPLTFANAPGLPGLTNFAAERQRVEDALYNRDTARLNPQFAQQQSHLDAQLAAQGVPTGTDAFRTAQSDLARNQADAYAAARNDAIQAGGAEQQRLYNEALSGRQQSIQEILTQRNQPINEIGALMGSGQVSMPQFQGAGPNQMSNAGYQSQLAGWQNQQQQQQAMMGGLFGLGGTLGAASIFAGSDERLKDKLMPAGMLGPFKLWLFRWKQGGDAQLGVMAQEVQKIAPHLVYERSNGMLGVDYGRLIEEALR